MYTFELHYIDIDTDREIIKTLKVDSQLYDTEKEIFIHAMKRAYDMMKEYELFTRLDYKGSYQRGENYYGVIELKDSIEKIFI